MRHSLFYCIVLGFVAGIFIHSVFSFSLSFIFLIILISGALVIFYITPDFRRFESPSLNLREEWGGILILVCIFFLSLGLLRFHLFTSWHGDELLEKSVGQKSELIGVVVEESAPKETYTQLIVKVDTLHDQKIIPTKILVMDNAFSKRQYGDRVRVAGKIIEPENFTGDSGREFDYKKYLAKDKIFFQIRYAHVSLIESGQGNIVKSLILASKKKFTDALGRSLPSPESHLASGLIVAGKYALPKNIQEEFITTGTVQVVVLSGYNVTIIAETLILLFSSLPKLLGVSLGGVSIIFFAIATGGSATIVRATLMVLVALLGKILRRKYDVGRALIVSALCMLVHNPMLLVFDPSFQLSFLATVGLIYFTPVIETQMSFVSEKYNLKNTVASTTATQIFVTPFLLYLTGTFSVVALPANLALFLVTPLAMLASFIAGLTEIFLPFLSVVTGFAAFVLLRLMLTLVHIFSAFPLASLSVQSFPLWGVSVLYFCYAVIIYRFSKVKQLPHES